MSCVCSICQYPVDCGEKICPRCEVNLDITKECSDGQCPIRLNEVKPGVYKFKRDDGSFYLGKIDK